jgi:small subunit ribosomal protein S14
MLKYQNYKDKVRRQKFLICENERLRIKSILHNRSLPISFRLFYSIKLAELPLDGSQVRLRNRCVITNRGQSIYRLFHLSRITLKEFVGLNRIPGIRKSSW